MSKYINDNDAEYLYHKLEALEKELLGTEDPTIADILCGKFETIKKQIDETDSTNFRDRAALKIISKRDPRIPAYKGRRVKHKLGIAAMVVMAVALVCCVSFFIYSTIQKNKEKSYEAAVIAMENKDYSTAYTDFAELGSYKQSSFYADYCSLCKELIDIQSSDEPVKISVLKGKLDELDKYDIDSGSEFDSLFDIVSFAESFYNTEWEGGGYTDSVSKEKFKLGVRIGSGGGITATSFRADGYLVDATWSYADKYTMVYYDGQLYGLDDKYQEYLEIVFYEDHIEYNALDRLSKEESTVYRIK